MRAKREKLFFVDDPASSVACFPEELMSGSWKYPGIDRINSYSGPDRMFYSPSRSNYLKVQFCSSSLLVKSTYVPLVSSALRRKEDEGKGGFSSLSTPEDAIAKTHSRA